jgi:elongation factor G
VPDALIEIAIEPKIKADREKPVLLEPIMKVEVITPLDLARDVLGDLRTRRGAITHQDQRDDDLVIHAVVPLANLFGYSKSLPALSEGRARYAMEFSHYAPVPQPPSDDRFRPAIGLRA